MASSERDLAADVGQLLEVEFAAATAIGGMDAAAALAAAHGAPALKTALAIATMDHLGRGVVLTLAAAKVVRPEQDIRAHQENYKDGFPARSVDARGTVPFLRRHDLAAASETHWLTRRIVERRFDREAVVTTPPAIGRMVGPLVCDIEESGSPELARLVVRILLVGMIAQRDRDRVRLNRLHSLTVEDAVALMAAHLGRSYSASGPRLPQLAIFAIYQCLIPSMKRFAGLTLRPLEHYKAADAKAETVGDVELLRDGRPVEAVEVKFGMAATEAHVDAAIRKIKATSVKRYYILATLDVEEAERSAISQKCERHYRGNGCEIIVNGILPTLKYYLRLLGSADEFVERYAALVEADSELAYEHRAAWNLACEQYAQAR